MHALVVIMLGCVYIISYTGTLFSLCSCSVSSRKRSMAIERKHATFGIGGGDDGTE